MFRKFHLFFLLILTSFVFGRDQNVKEKKIVIVTCSYNNCLYYKWNLDSILSQNYHNYEVIYVDDNSTDSSLELVTEYLDSSVVPANFSSSDPIRFPH